MTDVRPSGYVCSSELITRMLAERELQLETRKKLNPGIKNITLIGIAWRKKL